MMNLHEELPRSSQPRSVGPSLFFPATLTSLGPSLLLEPGAGGEEGREGGEEQRNTCGDCSVFCCVPSTRNKAQHTVGAP